MCFLCQYVSLWNGDQVQWPIGVNLRQVHDFISKATCVDVLGVHKLACALFRRSSLRRTPSKLRADESGSKLPHSGLDIFLCLAGNQSPLNGFAKAKEAAIRRFVKALMHAMNEAYSQPGIVSWTAVASVGQWSRARHRFGLE